MRTLQNKGFELRSYYKNNRTAFLYLLDDFYVEVIFLKDDQELSPEKITTFESAEAWSSYFESGR